MYKNIPTQSIRKPLFKTKGISVDVLRLDLIHPHISGNKWFKLKYHIEEAIRLNKNGILTFGGAYSNHLVATAVACQENNLMSVGIIRGEETLPLNDSIIQMKDAGMQLVYVRRNEYRNHKGIPGDYGYNNYLVVPEGGKSEYGIKGAAEILMMTSNTYTYVMCAVGTGTTLAGLIKGGSENQHFIGVSALKMDAHDNDVLRFVTAATNAHNFTLLYDYHFGGYAKRTDSLIRFMNQMYTEQQIPTDFVYTGKLFYALYNLVQKNYFAPGSSILVVHSGGLQGNRSLPAGTLVF